MEGQYQIM